MTEYDLRKLKRNDLLEMMLDQAKELERVKQELEQRTGQLEQCRKELEAARAALHKREIDINEAGSIAVAALKLNGIFEVAQAASQQYIENIKRLNERQEMICARRSEENRLKTEQMLKETEQKCRTMEEDAKRRSEAYWTEVSQRLQAFYDDHRELKRLLNTAPLTGLERDTV